MTRRKLTNKMLKLSATRIRAMVKNESEGNYNINVFDYPIKDEAGTIHKDGITISYEFCRAHEVAAQNDCPCDLCTKWSIPEFDIIEVVATYTDNADGTTFDSGVWLIDNVSADKETRQLLSIEGKLSNPHGFREFVGITPVEFDDGFFCDQNSWPSHFEYDLPDGEYPIEAHAIFYDDEGMFTPEMKSTIRITNGMVHVRYLDSVLIQMYENAGGEDWFSNHVGFHPPTWNENTKQFDQYMDS